VTGYWRLLVYPRSHRGGEQWCSAYLAAAVDVDNLGHGWWKKVDFSITAIHPDDTKFNIYNNHNDGDKSPNQVVVVEKEKEVATSMVPEPDSEPVPVMEELSSNTSTITNNIAKAAKMVNAEFKQQNDLTPKTTTSAAAIISGSEADGNQEKESILLKSEKSMLKSEKSSSTKKDDSDKDEEGDSNNTSGSLSSSEGESDFNNLRREDSSSSLTYEDLGDLTYEEVKLLGQQWFPDSSENKEKLQSIWKKHPKNKQGKKEKCKFFNSITKHK
jgi:hypothetical protein